MPMDKERVNTLTSFKKEYVAETIARAENLKKDPDRAKRRSEGFCIDCYYAAASFAGQAFTTAKCSMCDCDVMSSTTHTFELCVDCAKKYKLCKNCGADLELKMRRKI